ncbi:virion structural protein [Arthrobacter phage Sarge]|uniref:Minor tail protein n=1 Tax=Arthrobacter phage Sarge TaxID=2885974 RepID=A0AAE8Y5E0_9CAUD|nr:virion structural protein [Arthrobacter phage Sarge]UDL14866.1 minor tail protein [Arthrobacter phage Sarge]
MAIITGGYDGTVDEVQFAGLIPRYSVVGPDDFKATTQAGDRIVAIGNGTALGPGTIDVASNLPVIQFAAAATGTTRWDLVALRRDWQPPGGVSEIVIIQGGTSEAYPAVGTSTTAWNRRPGIMDDQPLYLQQVNGTLLGTRIDLRCWFSNGGLTAVHDKAKTYLQTLGTEILINGVRWQYRLGANNVPEWWAGDVVYYNPLTVNGYSTYGDITVEQVGQKKRVIVDITIERTGQNIDLTTGWSGFGAVLPAAARGLAPVKYPPVAIIGGGNNGHATMSVNPSDGVIMIRGITNFQWTTGALATLNLSYII